VVNYIKGKRAKHKSLSFLYFYILGTMAVFHGLPMRAQELMVMTYNCENAFDTLHDEGKSDMEFLPDGNHHWTRYRMFQKLKNIGKVIVSANQTRPIDLVGLEEVENDTVLTLLCHNTPLASIGYRYIMTHSADSRGIDVALLYSPYTFYPLNYHSIRAATTTPTRDVLYVSGVTGGSNPDTLDVYVVHLPSKLNGRESERNRQVVISSLMTSVDSLRQIRQIPKIIIMGDFNDGPKSKLIRRQFKNFISVVPSSKSAKLGSYKYQGAWDTIDHIFISHELNDKSFPGLHYDSSAIIFHPFLLEEDRRYGGQKPFRTYVGYTYNGGFSDHLPVMMKLKVPNP